MVLRWILTLKRSICRSGIGREVNSVQHILTALKTASSNQLRRWTKWGRAVISRWVTRLRNGRSIPMPWVHVLDLDRFMCALRASTATRTTATVCRCRRVPTMPVTSATVPCSLFTTRILTHMCLGSPVCRNSSAWLLSKHR